MTNTRSTGRKAASPVRTALFAATALAASAAFAPQAQAAVVRAAFEDNTIRLNTDGTTVLQNVNDFAARIGEFFSPNQILSVTPFQLPTLGAGQTFSTATFRTQLFGRTDGTSATVDFGNVDLFGITGVRAAPAVVGSDANAAATLIMDNYVTPDSPVRTDATTGPFIFTDAGGDAALTSFLNDAYAGGANAGQYVFFRAQYDGIIGPGTGNTSYTLLTRDTGNVEEGPRIIYDVTGVPEPAALGLLAAGGLLLGARRRR